MSSLYPNKIFRTEDFKDPAVRNEFRNLTRVLEEMQKQIGSSDGWTTVFKQADQSKASDTVLAADTELLFSMAADTRYTFEAQIYVFSANATPDFKFRHSGPAAPAFVSISRNTRVIGSGVFTSGFDDAYSAADVTMISPATGSGMVFLWGTILNGPTAGPFNFQWAQNTSDVNITTVKAGSFIRWSKV